MQNLRPIHCPTSLRRRHPTSHSRHLAPSTSLIPNQWYLLNTNAALCQRKGREVEKTRVSMATLHHSSPGPVQGSAISCISININKNPYLFLVSSSTDWDTCSAGHSAGLDSRESLDTACEWCGNDSSGHFCSIVKFRIEIVKDLRGRMGSP